MNNFLYKTKIVFGVFLAAVMLLSAGAMNMAFAANDSTVRNPEDVTLPDGVVLSKTAKEVDGKINSWDVTLRVEVPQMLTTSDTVIVIDKSGSMVQNGSERMKEAKTAAKSLAAQLLSDDNATNRVALVSFEFYITVHKFDDEVFTANYEDVASAIDGLWANGGTFTQGAIRKAAELLTESDADIKNIVLLSDGLPTHNYKMYNPDDYLIDGGPGDVEYEKQTSETVPESEFNHDIIMGAGDRMWYRYRSVQIDVPGEKITYERHYYNSGNCAIAEAGYYKNNTNGELYTVALDMNEDGNALLAKIASPGKAYAVSKDDLFVIFEQIGGRIISDASRPAIVNDTMGGGIVISGESIMGEAGADSIEWTPEFAYDKSANKYVAEMTYRVEADEKVLEYVDEDGFAPLNKKATITYGIGKTADFPVPMAKPIFEDKTRSVPEPEEGYGQVEPEVMAKAPETGENSHVGQNTKSYVGANIAAAVAMASVVMLTIEIVVLRKRR